MDSQMEERMRMHEAEMQRLRQRIGEIPGPCEHCVHCQETVKKLIEQNQQLQAALERRTQQIQRAARCFLEETEDAR